VSNTLSGAKEEVGLEFKTFERLVLGFKTKS
jgi:hypothetical protein